MRAIGVDRDGRPRASVACEEGTKSELMEVVAPTSFTCASQYVHGEECGGILQKG